MWKRTDEAQTTQPTPPPLPRSANGPAPNRDASRVETPTEHVAVIGPLVVFKGELTGSENLNINGQVEGTINLPQHLLTIGPNGQIKAHVTAKSVVVVGNVTGNITATEKIEIRTNGSVEGDIASPSMAIAEGAHFHGSIDMQPSTPAAAVATSKDPGPARPSGLMRDAVGVGASSAAQPVPRP